jgi:hypothetical protein
VVSQDFLPEFSFLVTRILGLEMLFRVTGRTAEISRCTTIT